MNKYLDDYNITELSTEISECKDGYYAFKETIFFGNKGGMLADKGTINGYEVKDLRYENDILYHKVDEELKNPIYMKVDGYTRKVNTAVQSALHLLDGYYNKIGYYLPSVGVEEDDEWYEVNNKNIDDNHLIDVEKYMQEAIEKDIKLKVEYIAGKDYPDEKYQNFDEVRIVSFGDLDRQPCGTLHVNSTKDIENFVILSREKTSRGTKVHFACGKTLSTRLRKEDKILKEACKTMGVKTEYLNNKLNEVLESSKGLKKEIEILKEENIKLKLKILNKEEKVIFFDCNEQSSLRLAANILADTCEEDHILYSTIDDMLNIAVSSKSGNARNIFKLLQENYGVSGGGSPKVALGKCDNLGIVEQLKTLVF